MVRLDIEDLTADFPHYRVALVVAVELEIAGVRSQALEREVAEAEARVAATIAERPPPEIPELKAWREAYKGFGVKKTSYRSSVERLIRSIQQGRGLPRVNALVDAYNVVSALSLMPVGADDLDRVTGPLAFRRSRPGDSFIRLGEESGAEDPPKDREVVYADAEKVLCRRWNWAQDARSAISPATRGAVLTVQSLAPGPALESAAADLCRRLARHCAARSAWAVADSERPWAEVALD